MRRRCLRVIMQSGVATVNVNGQVSTSLDAERNSCDLFFSPEGVYVQYVESRDEKTRGASCEQLIPAGALSNVIFDPEEKWFDETKPQAKAAK